uniref:Agouti-signaling protein n=1 Tax=Leptobrachium leishanense TaxID=445787 RepID=A0A8C5QM50_9ANUR
MPDSALYKRETCPALGTHMWAEAGETKFEHKNTDMKWMSLLFFMTCLLGLGHSHIVLEEKRDETNSGSIIRFPELLPPISIVDLTKASRRVSRVDAEKNKMAKRKVPQKKKLRPPPPANCVPLLSSCKPPAPPCCEHCAICQCHIFQTMCVYRMGYPQC